MDTFCCGGRSRRLCGTCVTPPSVFPRSKAETSRQLALRSVSLSTQQVEGGDQPTADASVCLSVCLSTRRSKAETSRQLAQLKSDLKAEMTRDLADLKEALDQYREQVARLTCQKQLLLNQVRRRSETASGTRCRRTLWEVPALSVVAGRSKMPHEAVMDKMGTRGKGAAGGWGGGGGGG
jgi:hypothetical protein